MGFCFKDCGLLTKTMKLTIILIRNREIEYYFEGNLPVYIKLYLSLN